jgi:predicted MPP superfamily phosphohydrolase
MSAARLRGIVARVNALRPDLVVLTGDYVGDKTLGGTPLAAAEAVSPFGNLRPRIGTFAVLGNHDHWFDPAGLAAALRRSGIHVLTNEHVSAGPVIVAGVDDEFTGRADLARAPRGINADRPVILLSHSPDVFPEVDGRVGVTVAGHTHGGQIALPFIGALATASKYGKRYAHGHVVESGRHLIVSAGLGTSLLPLRIGVPPEIVLVTIH